MSASKGLYRMSSNWDCHMKRHEILAPDFDGFCLKLLILYCPSKIHISHTKFRGIGCLRWIADLNFASKKDRKQKTVFSTQAAILALPALGLPHWNWTETFSAPLVNRSSSEASGPGPVFWDIGPADLAVFLQLCWGMPFHCFTLWWCLGTVTLVPTVNPVYGCSSAWI